jgi:hypothetical protein
MRLFHVLLFVVATSTAAFCSPGGVLEKVTKIQVDPTVVEQPEKVKDAIAANLIRYNLRAAVKDAHLEEGESPIRAHFVLDEFTSESNTKRLMGLTGDRDASTVDGRLVIQDATGKELASIKIHLRGSVTFSQVGGDNTKGRQATSDFEQRLLKEIEGLK